MFPFCSCVCQDYTKWLIISNNAKSFQFANTVQVDSNDEYPRINEISLEIVFPETENTTAFVIPDMAKLSRQVTEDKPEIMFDSIKVISPISESIIVNDVDGSLSKQDIMQSNLISNDDLRLLNQVNNPIDKQRLIKIQRSKKFNKRRQSINFHQRIRICNPDRFGLVDLSNGHLTEKYLIKYLTSWEFNIFRLNRFTGGKSTLVHLGMGIFQSHNLINHFRFDYDSLKGFMYSVQSVYHSYNPYHNALHSADVAQSMHCFLSDHKIKSISNPIEVLGCIIAALCHDADHPGLNQLYLEKINHYFVSFYNHSSVLENHHIRVTLSLLHQSTLLNFLSADDWRTLVPIITNLILATDITHQKSYLNKFINLNHEKKCSPYSLVKYSPEEKTLIYQMALKCSDISNPCRSWPVSLGWASLVCEEFFLQGDVEKTLGLSVLTTHDRCMSTKADIQLGFIRFIVRPLIVQWNCFLTSNLSVTLVKQVDSNLNSWESFKQRFGAISSKTLQSQPMKIEINSPPLLSGLATLTEETTLTSTCVTKHQTNYQRRFSLPDAVTRPTSNPLKKVQHNSSTTIITFPRLSTVTGSCRRGSLPQHRPPEQGRRRGSLPLNVRAFPVPSAWEESNCNKTRVSATMVVKPPSGQGRRGSAPLIGYHRCSQDHGIGGSGLGHGCSRDQMLLEVYWMTASSSVSSVASCLGASNGNVHLLSSMHRSSSSSSSRNDSGAGGYVTII